MASTPFYLPSEELKFSFARSGGAGGQNVNKAATKVTLRWSPLASRVLTLEQKARLLTRLGARLTAAGEIIIHAERERSQAQNRAAATARLNELVARALRPVKPRRPTKPSRAARARRLEHKQKHSRKKQARRRVFVE